VAAPHASAVGGVLSADIAVPEYSQELQFYARVLTTGASPLWREDLMNSAGTPIIGLGERSPAYADLPLQWMPHIQVADVALSAERALARSGRALLHHKGDRGESQWAVLLDPNGAAFGIIPVVASEGIASDSGGRIAWLDLTVDDASATRDFYEDVVGWSVQDVPMEDAQGRYADYSLCTPDRTAVAGVRHARGTNEDLPPVWLICLPVGDLAESLGRVREGGGEVVDARRGATGEYAHAVVRDPVGAYFALVPG
jgi:predicted enzyme related to lactoylglutathione lyase